MKRNFLGLSTAAAVLPMLAACGCGGSSTVRVTASDAGASRQALAAAPLASFDTICLNVADVRVKVDADDEGEGGDEVRGEDGWYHLDLLPPEEAVADGTTDDATEAPPCPLDLAALLRGEKINLAWGEVPSGDMTEMRFVLGGDQGYAIPVGQTYADRIPVLVPSGSQSGLKFKGASVPLEPDEEHEVELVFDAEASIREHNGGALRIRPVVHVRGVETVPDDENDGGTGGAGGELQ